MDNDKLLGMFGPVPDDMKDAVGDILAQEDKGFLDKIAQVLGVPAQHFVEGSVTGKLSSPLPSFQSLPKDSKVTFLDPPPMFYEHKVLKKDVPQWVLDEQAANHDAHLPDPLPGGKTLEYPVDVVIQFPPAHPNCRSLPAEAATEPSLFADPSIDEQRPYDPRAARQVEKIEQLKQAYGGGLADGGPVAALKESYQAVHDKLAEQAAKDIEYAVFEDFKVVDFDPVHKHKSSKGAKVAHPSYQKFNKSKGKGGKKVY